MMLRVLRTIVKDNGDGGVSLVMQTESSPLPVPCCFTLTREMAVALSGQLEHAVFEMDARETGPEKSAHRIESNEGG